MPTAAVAAALTVAQIVVSRLLAGKKPDVGPRQSESRHLLVDSVAPMTLTFGTFPVSGSLVAARSHPPNDRDHFTEVRTLSDHPSEAMTHVWVDNDRLEIGVDLEANATVQRSGTITDAANSIEVDEPGGPQYAYIDLDAGASSEDDFYEGMTFTMTSGGANGQSKTILGYDGSQKRVFFGYGSPGVDWSPLPVSGDSYEIKVEVVGWEDWLVPVQGSPNGSKYIRGGEPLFGVKIYLGAQVAADTRLVAIDPGNWWGSDRIGENTTYAAITWKTDAELGFGARMPEFRFEGQWANDVYDWRTSSRGYTNNAVLCLARWLEWEHGPFQRLDANWDSVGIDEADFVSAEMIAEANVADEAVTLLDGVTTQPRYTFDGIISADDNPEEVFQRFFLALGGGMLVQRGNQFFVRCGYERSPVMAFTEKSIAYGQNKGPVTRRRHSKRERFNTVEGEYFDGRPSQGYERTTYPPVDEAAYITADGGRRRLARIDLDGVTNHERAQRLATIQLARHRHELTITAPFLFTAGEPPGPWRLEVGDVVTLDRPIYTAPIEFWVQHLRGLDDGLTELTLRQHADFWSWDRTFAGDVAEGNNLIVFDGQLTDTTGLAVAFVSGSETVRNDGRLAVSMRFTCDEHSNAIVRRRGSYLFRLRELGGTPTDWTSIKSDDPAAIFEDLIVGRVYEAQCRAELVTGSSTAKSLWRPYPPLNFNVSTAEFPITGPPGSGSSGENRVPNPNFEQGLTGWSATLAATGGPLTANEAFVLSTTDGKFGSNAAKITSDNRDAINVEPTEKIKIEIGEQYRLGLHAKWKGGSGTPSPAVTLLLAHYNVAGTLTTLQSLGTINFTGTDSDTWKLLKGILTITQTGTVFASLRAQLTWDVDDQDVEYYLDGAVQRWLNRIIGVTLTTTAEVNVPTDGSSGTTWQQFRTVTVGKPGTVNLRSTFQAKVAMPSITNGTTVDAEFRIARYDSDGVSNETIIQGPDNLLDTHTTTSPATELSDLPWESVQYAGSDPSINQGEYVYEFQFRTNRLNGEAQAKNRNVEVWIE